MVELRRKLYKRGSSYETTIPFPLLFTLDLEKKKYDVVFGYEPLKQVWTITFEERAGEGNTKRKKQRTGKGRKQ